MVTFRDLASAPMWFSLGALFSVELLGFGHAWPELYLMPLVVHLLVVLCKWALWSGSSQGDPNCITGDVQRSWAEIQAMQHKQKAAVAQMKETHSPNKPVPLSVQAKWALGSQRPC